MDPITLALGLAQAVPAIMGWFGAGKESVAVANNIAQTAKKITGKDSNSEIINAIATDPAMAMQLQLAIMNDKNKLDEMYLADLKDARAHDDEYAKAGVQNYRANVLLGFAMITVLGVMAVSVWNANLDEYVKGVLTLIIGRTLGYIDQAFSFEFGSTRSSKTKDDTISQLSKP